VTGWSLGVGEVDSNDGATTETLAAHERRLERGARKRGRWDSRFSACRAHTGQSHFGINLRIYGSLVCIQFCCFKQRCHGKYNL